MSLVVLISGRGSNLQAMVRARLPVAAVISNREDAGGLAYARKQGLAATVVPHKDFATREGFEQALAQEIDRHAPRAIASAGFMRVLTAEFVARYAGRIVNIHPSLLPAFPGLDTHARALSTGVKLHGCTVHFVTAALDGGPIIAQAAVPVLADDTGDALAARVLRQEHVLYPRALAWLLGGKLVTLGGRVSVVDTDEKQFLFAPDA